MIAALTLMCALSASECASSDARQIADAIDDATQDDGLRAVLTVYSHAESHWAINPKPCSWDSLAGVARGPWQLWYGGDAPLGDQARTWLHIVQQAGLASVDSSPARARKRAARAARLLVQTTQ